MFLHINNQGKNLHLDYPIDNACGSAAVALCEIFFKVNWFNISEAMKNNMFGVIDSDGPDVTKIPDGYYGFCALKERLKEGGVMAKLNDANLKVTLSFNEPGTYYFAAGLASMLGFKGRDFFNALTRGESFEGDDPVDLAKNLQLFVHLDELNTSQNLFNGKPSSVLRVITSGGVAYCQHEIRTFTNPQFKKLARGHFDTLNLSIRDKNGKIVVCDDLHLTLEII